MEYVVFGLLFILLISAIIVGIKDKTFSEYADIIREAHCPKEIKPYYEKCKEILRPYESCSFASQTLNHAKQQLKGDLSLYEQAQTQKNDKYFSYYLDMFSSPLSSEAYRAWAELYIYAVLSVNYKEWWSLQEFEHNAKNSILKKLSYRIEEIKKDRTICPETFLRLLEG